MAYQDIYNNLKEVVGIPAQAVSSDGDIAGEIVDTLGFESSEFVLSTGAVTAGDITIKEILESDDAGMAGATAIPAERLFNTPVAISAANTVDALGFLATKRYIQPVVTAAGTADANISGLVVLGDPQYATTR